MIGGFIVSMLWLVPLAATIWVTITTLRILNRIAIALERQAGLEPAIYAQILAPRRLRRPPVA